MYFRCIKKSLHLNWVILFEVRSFNIQFLVDPIIIIVKQNACLLVKLVIGSKGSLFE